MGGRSNNSLDADQEVPVASFRCISGLKASTSTARAHDREAKIVSNEEAMLTLVSQGWDLQRELNGGSFLLKRD